MALIWLGLAAIAVWALIRLGRQSERAGRGHWRITATIFGAVMMAGALLALARGAWLLGGALTAGGLYVITASRIRVANAHTPEPESMTEAEARRTLGVAEGASPAEVQAAWKRLMARAHPDQGGSEGLASRLNAARDRLAKT
jgi:DnaJ-domain-containing protein 1